RELLERMRSDPLFRLLNDQLPYDARVLEAGCGAGDLTNALSVAYRTVVDIDDDPAALGNALAVRRLHQFERSSFIRMDPAAPALRPGGFDIVLATGALGRTPPAYLGRALTKLIDLLRPGGHLVVLVADPLAQPLARLARRLDPGRETGRSAL